MFLGIDVGGTKIAAALVSEDGDLVGKIREPIDQSSDGSAVEQLCRLVGQFQISGVQGVGVGIPGIADQKQKRVWAPNVRGWDHISLEAQLQNAAHVLVTVESDRNTAILGELLFGAARQKHDVVFLIVGTGIGAGILAGGRLVRGSKDIGGAVGWIPVNFENQPEHFEDIASGPGIERLAKRLYGLEARLPDLVQRAREGHPIRDLFARIGSVIGQALSVFVSTLNPELIVLGGGVSNAWDLMEETAHTAMERWSQPIAVKQVQIVASTLGEDAGILGAAAAAMHTEELL